MTKVEQQFLDVVLAHYQELPITNLIHLPQAIKTAYEALMEERRPRTPSEKAILKLAVARAEWQEEPYGHSVSMIEYVERVGDILDEYFSKER